MSESEIIGRPPLPQLNNSISEPALNNERAFIVANTIRSSKDEIKREHVIPVFVKDNETVISHTDFIEIMQEMTEEFFAGETILRPSVRILHPIKGRAGS